MCKKDENQFQCPQEPHVHVITRKGRYVWWDSYRIHKEDLPTERKVRDEWIEKINKLKFISTKKESDEFLYASYYAGESRHGNDVYARKVKDGLLP